MDDIVICLILVMFPILIYFIYNCYRELCMEKYNQTLFGVALVSSMYLCLRFGNVRGNFFVLLFCNLPIVFAYLKKEMFIAVLMSVCVILYVSYFIHVHVIFLICMYVSYFVIYLIYKNKKVTDNTFVMCIVILQGFFLSSFYFGVFGSTGNTFFLVMQIVVIMLFFYLLPFVVLYLFRLADKITSLYLSVSLLEKDKQIRNSLFKITHEVKNPIAVCKGYLDMLDVNDKEKVRRYIPIIKGEIARSLDIMSDFMEFSKIKIDKEIIDINLLLDDIVEEFKLLICNKKIVMDCHVMNDEIYIEGDYNRLKQVFVNLVKNSMEAIEGMGKIQIITHMLKGQYYIEIIDDGIGMDSLTLNKVKEMFFTTKAQGSGLGVSLSNEIIKAHDGEIDYFSKVGKGTKVVVKLPVIML